MDVYCFNTMKCNELRLCLILFFNEIKNIFKCADTFEFSWNHFCLLMKLQITTLTSFFLQLWLLCLILTMRSNAIGKPQLGILWSRDSLGFNRLCGNSSWNYVVFILNCMPVYPISSLNAMEQSHLTIYWNRFSVVFDKLVQGIFCTFFYLFLYFCTFVHWFAILRLL